MRHSEAARLKIQHGATDTGSAMNARRFAALLALATVAAVAFSLFFVFAL